MWKCMRSSLLITPFLHQKSSSRLINKWNGFFSHTRGPIKPPNWGDLFHPWLMKYNSWSTLSIYFIEFPCVSLTSSTHISNIFINLIFLFFSYVFFRGQIWILSTIRRPSMEILCFFLPFHSESVLTEIFFSCNIWFLKSLYWRQSIYDSKIFII